ncbi:MAG: hypothetical protein RBS72_09645 [Sedimentisphaerales bacterium]|jgi:hypothetical protein|nr:hypothetical protein [Sedimentisphaerales bacterium]HNY77843.1 hypothetical protein [Sedimentisphaerales bacterium]HOC63108.1 hypothetical protein [Sedimentisphaerales bacterium]HOH64018.1 hypothetical protein [Sedimentisphaerales bacterium]HPY48268.1 hypothetical protein [Sedimentisphaerales bacterium]
MKANKALYLGLAILVGGCVPVISLQPLFTKDTLFFDEHLLGTWVENPSDTSSAWVFTRLGQGDADTLPDALKDSADKVYHLGLTDPEGRKGSFFACLVKLDSNVFLDIFPDVLPSGQGDPEKAELFYNAFLFVRAHTFVKVDLSGNRMSMWLTNDDKINGLLESRPSPIAYESVDDQPILTASTKDLQAFVSHYAGDDRVFADEIILERLPQ